MKSIFHRILSMMALVLLLSFILIGAGFRFEFQRYYLKDKADRMTAQAAEVGEIANSFRVFENDDESDSFRIGLNYSSSITNTETLVADSCGIVCFSSDSNYAEAFMNATIPEGYIKLINEKSPYFGNDNFGGFFQEQKIYVVTSIKNIDNHEIEGYVIVFSEPEEMGNQLAKTTNIFLILALIVLVIAVAASSYVANVETKPLMALADTASKFGRGELSARVAMEKSSSVEVQELTRAFNSMADSLENSERKRREFIANVSHELKTPMTTIAGFMDGMIDGTIPQEQHEKYMRTVAEEVRRLSRLVRNMLEISRIQDRGMPKEKMRRFDVCESIGRTLLSFEQKIYQKQLFVEVQMPESGLYVKAEEDSITQVIYNLIDNAVKFCNQQGKLFIQASSDGSHVTVSIANTGPTISPDEIPLVFDRFHKTDKSRSIDRDGAGLGLYLAKTIIVAHGEDINVTSRDGVTRFWFTLPFGG